MGSKPNPTKISEYAAKTLAVFLITGANRGIGLEFCRQLKGKGNEVIAVCRKSSKELDELNIQTERGVDLASEASIVCLKEKLSNTKVDVLILNAGIAETNCLENLDVESIKDQFAVNAIGPLLLTANMLNNLREGSKVILVTSRMGSIKDNNSGGSYGYRMSKAALCMAGKSLSIDLRPYGISVALLHPGLVSTRMTGFTPHGITPEQSVIGLLNRIDSLTIDSSGGFWHSNGETLPW